MWMPTARSPPLLISQLIQRIQHPDCGGGGARIEFESSGQSFFPLLVLETWNRVSTYLALAAGSFLFCRRQAWQDTGGFDESFYAAEELAFSQSLKKWCRQHKLRFRIITEAAVRTSARKLDWHSSGRLFLIMLSLLRPGALKNRDLCGFWYQRPA
ncbi:MAG: hypothetical protein HC904_04930 [Blastochloris sp.]|nr:hypothetical protein [Blastochloris sp.]